MTVSTNARVVNSRKLKTKRPVKRFSSKDPDYDLWLLLAQTRHSIFRARQRELDDYGLTTKQASVLFAIEVIGDKTTPAEIARFLLREPHSISELVSRMEKDGLVKKVKDLDRKNLVRVAFTEKGKKAHRIASKRESIHDILAVLTEKERSHLQLSLDKLMKRALLELGKRNRMPFAPPNGANSDLSD